MNNSYFSGRGSARPSLRLLLTFCVAAAVYSGLQFQAVYAGGVFQRATPAFRGAATPTPTAPPAMHTVQAVSSLPAEQTELYAGLTVGFTESGRPYIGDPGAPITLDEYSDYLCPFCGRHFRETYPLLLDDLVATGKVRLVFHEFPIPALHPTAPTGHQAALCVAEQGAAHFWAMHDALFARQSDWNSLPDPTEFVARLAAEAGAEQRSSCSSLPARC